MNNYVLKRNLSKVANDMTTINKVHNAELKAISEYPNNDARANRLLALYLYKTNALNVTGRARAILLYIAKYTFSYRTMNMSINQAINEGWF